MKKGLKYPGVLAIYDRSPDGISSGNKTHLVKYHYHMHRDSNHFGPVVAGFFTVTNIANYINNVVVCEKRQNKGLN